MLACVCAWLFVPHASSLSSLFLPATPGVDASKDFSANEIAREVSFHNQVRPLQLISLAISVGFPIVIAVIAQQRSWCEDLTPQNLRWWLAGTAFLMAVGVIALPLQYRVRQVLTEVGLNTQSTSSWLMDVAKSVILSTAITLPLVACLVWVARKNSTSQLLMVPAAAMLITVVMSFLIPVIVEPLFNQFAPMKEGPLRTSLIDMASSVGAPVKEVLVADASRRTTALNAYVSGIGPSRRVVVYDTMLSAVPADQIEMVAAHELGHVVNNDVWHNTVISSLLAASAALIAVLVVGLSPGREVIVLTALLGLGALISNPITNAMSRQIERRADEFAIQHAPLHQSDPDKNLEVFISMQRELALKNMSSLVPPTFMYVMFASHPTGPERIALARSSAGR